MEKKQRARKNKGVLGILVSMVCYALIGAISGLFLLRTQDSLLPADAPAPLRMLFFLGSLAVLYLGIFFQFILHEAGHLVFGLLSGYGFSSFRVGSLMWVKEAGRIRFRRFRLAGTGGQCLMTPPELVEGRMPVVLHNLGGSLMNLIFALIFGSLGLLLGVRSLWGGALLTLALIGLSVALINGLPMRVGPVDNDGRNTLSLVKSPLAVRAFWTQMKVVEETARGVRVKDMPAEWFALPSDQELKNNISAVVGVLACNRLMDEHRFGEADALMARLLSMETGINGLHRTMLTGDRIYVELITENRPEALAALLTKEQKKSMKSMGTNISMLRTQYAYALLAEKDEKKAEKWETMFEKQARVYPYPVEAEGERELLEIARQRAERE